MIRAQDILIFSSCNPRLPKILRLLVQKVMRCKFLSHFWPKTLFTKAFLVRGKTTNSVLTTLFLGDLKFLNYFSKLVYTRHPEIQPLGDITYYNIPSKIAGTTPDIILVADADRIFSSALSREGFFILPVVRFTLDVSGSWNIFLSRSNRERRRLFRKIKELGYVYETTNDPRIFSFFYYKMYLPHILKRHEESANLATFVDLYNVFQKGGLLLVKLNGKCVSGMLYNVDHDIVHACNVGVYEGSDEYYAEGASHAAFCLFIHWANQQGYKEIDFGVSKPFMKDGVFTYKRRWRMKVKPDCHTIYALKLCRFGNGVKEFLVDNPFVFADSDGLKGLVFFNTKMMREAMSKEIRHRYSIPGLSDVVIISSSTNYDFDQSLRSILEAWRVRSGRAFLLNPPRLTSLKSKSIF